MMTYGEGEVYFRS